MPRPIWRKELELTIVGQIFAIKISLSSTDRYKISTYVKLPLAIWPQTVVGTTTSLSTTTEKDTTYSFK